MSHMQSNDFAEIQRQLGYSDRELADALGLAENGHKRVRRIKDGKLDCSGPMALAMLALEGGIRPHWWQHD